MKQLMKCGDCGKELETRLQDSTLFIDHRCSEADQRDAARYRWWVENYGHEYDSPVSRKLYTVVPAFKGKLDTKEKFDAAIDAAMSAQSDTEER
jgi:hypothetical protein